jgi:glyoxylase-like metal-dependent hydrolase (beta-lactamase superfamily II)
MECAYACKNSSQKREKRDSEGVPKSKTNPAAVKYALFNVDLKISGAQSEILLGDGIIQTIHAPKHSPGSMV